MNVDRFSLSEGQLLMRFATLQNGEDRVQIVVAPHARLDLFLIEDNPENQREGWLDVEVGEEATVNLVQLTLNTRKSLTHLHFKLVGEKAEVNVSGAVLADGEQQSEIHVLMEHQAESCRSNMLYKQVLCGKSLGLVEGKVLVQPGAQKTESQQTFANILNEKGARAQSLPMLEIYADDVKCNHGSTVGKLDETALFYMRQRGIPYDMARQILQKAFVNEVLHNVSHDSVQMRLSQMIEHRLTTLR